MPLPTVTIFGAGYVGATTAHLLALKGLADITLIDVVDGLAQGKGLDMLQSGPVEGFSGRIEGSTDMGATVDSRLVIITAGRARKPGMSRDDLLAANVAIVGPIADAIKAQAPEAIVIVVTNPLDVMVALMLQRTGFPRRRVMGMAGVVIRANTSRSSLPSKLRSNGTISQRRKNASEPSGVGGGSLAEKIIRAYGVNVKAGRNFRSP